MPALTEPVQVLEDVAVAAADAGVLGDVDDPQTPVGCADLAAVEPVPTLRPEMRLRATLALPDVGAPGGRLDMGQAGARLKTHLPA